MLSRTTLAVAGAIAALVTMTAPALCEPPATDVLFKQRQLDDIGRGAAVKYHFERKVTDEKLLGPNFSDDIEVGVLKVNEKGEREVALRIFTGERKQDEQNYPDLTINPIFLWYLDRTVKNLASLTGATGNYLKGNFRAAFETKGKVELIKTDFGGKQVTGYKISIQPFIDDPYAPRMRGYSGSSFTFIVSDQVPGYFVDLLMNIESTNKGAPKIEERLALQGLGEAK